VVSDMCNAKEELLQHVNEIKTTFKNRIKCAECFSINTNEQLEIYRLTIDYTETELHEFYNRFNFEYIDIVEFTEEMMLTGTIWWSDGSWSVRDVCGEFESWIYYRAPDIPKILKHRSSSNVVNLFNK
jgi:hypothetical protein